MASPILSPYIEDDSPMKGDKKINANFTTNLGRLNDYTILCNKNKEELFAYQAALSSSSVQKGGSCTLLFS